MVSIGKFKQVLINVSLIFFGFILSLLFCELILRIHNPLPSKIIGDSIRLLKNYERTIIIRDQDEFSFLDDTISYSTNSIGFRGQDPPNPFDDFFTLITVGGSTTECSLLDDNKTWPYLLGQELASLNHQIWLNNAGIDGCSTFGHQLLLREHIYDYRPNMVLFLVGVNDLLLNHLQENDLLDNSREYRLRTLSQKSELFSLLWNLYRQTIHKNHSVGHIMSPRSTILSKSEYSEQSVIHQRNQKYYAKRLEQIVDDCIERGIEPVLITQPIHDIKELDFFQFIEYYNCTTINIGIKKCIKTIDLASAMKDSSNYFYDRMHYTNEGAVEVSKLIYNELIKTTNILKESKKL